MKKFLLVIFALSFLFANNCNKKLFTIHLKKPIKFSDILSDISSECNLNIIVKDEKSKNILNSNINFVNLENVPLTKLLNVLFDNKNLFYKLENDKLYVYYYKTKTFKLDFIPNSITGTSNVDTDDNSVKTNYTFDFWKNLETNLKNILSNIDSNYKDPVIDKNAGLITITANKIQLRKISKYLEKLSERLHKEVLIDVRIYSVELSESHQTGIDWSQFSLQLNKQNVPLQLRNIGGHSSVFNSATFSVKALVNFLAQNGNVNSISNPKIATLNNQKALIRVGDTIYYKNISQVTIDANGNPITTYTIDSKFIGVVLDITPQISDNGDIILSINPRISSFKDLLQLQDVNREMPPDIKENSLISVVRMKNNQTLVLGGLIVNDDVLNVNGIPVLKEIPIIKYLFSSKEKVTDRKELVFVITPHIINLKSNKTLKDYGYKKLPSLEDLDVR
jgi:general secretion pathway protein D